jgi:hypothetical protein
MSAAWLPELVTLDEYGGHWEEYLNALYGIFLNDFVRAATFYKNEEIKTKRHPEINGQSATFWHIISEGQVETERTPNLRRCERIAWPKPILEHIEEPIIREWIEEQRGEQRIHIWLESEGYLVVLAKRNGYILLWTAYFVEEEHYKRKLMRRWEQYKS